MKTTILTARTLIAVLVAASAIGLSACGSAPESGSETVAAQSTTMATVNNSGVSVQIPTTWAVEYKDGQSFPVITPDTFEGLLQVGITSTYYDGYSSADDIFNDWLSVVTYADKSSEEDFSTDETPMKRYKCVVDENGTEGYAQVAVIGNEAVATIFVAKDFDSHEDEVLSVMDSMKVADPKEFVLPEGTDSGSSGDASATQGVAGDSAQDTNASVYRAGSYRVGKDLPAGEYKLTCSESHGYFCVYPDTTKADILSNANFTTCTYISVSDGQLLEVSGATFVPSAEASPTSVATGDGTYKVGFDIPAGEYEVVQTDGSMGYYSILDSCDAVNSSIIDNDNFEGNSFISISDGQFLELSRATANPA